MNREEKQKIRNAVMYLANGMNLIAVGEISRGFYNVRSAYNILERIVK